MNKNILEIAGPDTAITPPPHPQPFSPEGERGETAAAWEEIAPGRYMPRRVRGSCHGRALG